MIHRCLSFKIQALYFWLCCFWRFNHEDDPDDVLTGFSPNVVTATLGKSWFTFISIWCLSSTTWVRFLLSCQATSGCQPLGIPVQPVHVVVRKYRVLLREGTVFEQDKEMGWNMLTKHYTHLLRHPLLRDSRADLLSGIQGLYQEMAPHHIKEQHAESHRSKPQVLIEQK